jgi:hypothetical protein
MPDASRVQRTADKTARGGLPAPIDDSPVVGSGRGSRCRGCSETIGPFEMLLTVTLLGALSLEFHRECYESWQTFKRRHANTA